MSGPVQPCAKISLTGEKPFKFKPPASAKTIASAQKAPALRLQSAFIQLTKRSLEVYQYARNVTVEALLLPAPWDGDSKEQMLFFKGNSISGFSFSIVGEGYLQFSACVTAIVDLLGPFFATLSYHVPPLFFWNRCSFSHNWVV